MEEVVNKNKCTGCTACMNICPKNAIAMKEDDEGFKYPVIDQSLCINCNLCKKTCPALIKDKQESITMCYAAYSKNNEERYNSSSGGIFPIIANHILSNKGIVIGAFLDETNSLRHIAIERKEDIKKIIGSKYIQSDLDHIFKYIKNEIKNKKILFVGTPCQVAGIKSIIRENDNLLCIDVICHGVPSIKLYKNYIKYLERKNNDKVIKFNFRDKSTGWDSYSNEIIFKTKKITEQQTDNLYMKLFLSDNALRRSCYDCNFKLGNKYSDITLGDFWGIKNIFPEMYNDTGVSAIIINSKKGKQIFEEINNEIIYKECPIENIIIGNQSLVKSPRETKNRDTLYKDVEKMPFNKLVKKYKKKSNIFKKIIYRLDKLKKCLKNNDFNS